jgi:hypothetical protein
MDISGCDVVVVVGKAALLAFLVIASSSNTLALTDSRACPEDIDIFCVAKRPQNLTHSCWVAAGVAPSGSRRSRRDNLSSPGSCHPDHQEPCAHAQWVKRWGCRLVTPHPGTHPEITEAYRANALFDAHRDDPEFGYRFLAEEARQAGEPMARLADLRGQRLMERVWQKRGKNGKAGPPVHNDFVDCDLTAEAPNRLWLSDINEHPTREGKLYLCAIKDAFSNRIVGYCMDSQMKSRSLR